MPVPPALPPLPPAALPALPEEERMKQRLVRPDPFENSLSTLLSQVHLDARLGHNEGGGKAASELSRETTR